MMNPTDPTDLARVARLEEFAVLYHALFWEEWDDKITHAQAKETVDRLYPGLWDSADQAGAARSRVDLVRARFVDPASPTVSPAAIIPDPNSGPQLKD